MKTDKSLLRNTTRKSRLERQPHMTTRCRYCTVR